MPESRSPLLRIFDYIFVLRPMLFFPGWSTLLAGYFIGYKRQLILTPEQWHNVNHLQVLQLFAIFAAAMGGSFLLNQLQDRESDRQNNKLFIISEGHVPLWSVWLEAALLISGSIAAAFYFSLQLGLLVVAFNILTGYLYNFKPFEMKNHPWRSLLANTLMGWLAFALGWVVFFPLGWPALTEALPYVFLNTALYLYTTLPDINGDQAAQKRTLSVKYSLSAILYSAFVLYVFAFVSAVLLHDTTALLIDALSAVFFILTLRNKDVPSAVRSTKFTIFFFAAVVCLKWPLYLLIMIIGFFATRWYFKQRFDFDYPNFK